MRIIVRQFLLLAIMLVSFSARVFPQYEFPIYQDTVKLKIVSIPIINIASQVSSTSSEILSKKANLLGNERKAALQSTSDTLLFRVRFLREDPRIAEINNLSFRNMRNLEREWSGMKARLLVHQNVLRNSLVLLETNIGELQVKSESWNLTLINARKELVSDQLLVQIEGVIDSLDVSLSLFHNDSDFIQSRMVQGSNSIIFCEKILLEIGAANDITGSHLLKVTQPPLWKALDKTREDTLIISPARALTDTVIVEIKEFVSYESFKILLHAIIFVILLIVISGLFRNLRSGIDDNTVTEAAVISRITRRPLSVTFLLTLLSTSFVYDSLPNSLAYLTVILLFPPVML
ncbi:MAG: hypothetical protein E4G95_07730, partial [Bacteroidia bacterium]